MAAAMIGKLFFPVSMPDWMRQIEAFGIFAAGFMARPLGGIVKSVRKRLENYLCVWY
jgi:hypothetical protein